MDHIADMVKDNDLRRVKLAITMIATMRGIPQLFAGDEYAQQSADLSMGHIGLRQPLPTVDQLTEEQKDMFNYQSKLFTWRKTQEVIHTGKTMHFISRDNTYAYFRYNDNKAVFVFINASDQPRQVPLDHYQEILGLYNHSGTDVITGQTINLTQPLEVDELSSVVIELNK